MGNKLKCLQIRNETDKHADVYIHGDVIDDTWKGWLSDSDGKTMAGYVLPTDVKAQLDALAGKDLTIYVNSDGGLVPAGIAIANMIARHDGHTVGIIDGWAASIASVIFMACDELRMPSNTFLMVHKPSAGVLGSAPDMRRVADALDTIQAGIEKTHQECSREGVTADAIHADVEAETWYTAEQAAEKYQITVIEPQAQMVAYSKGIDFKHMPDAVRDMKTAPDEPKNELARKKAYILEALAKGGLVE